MNSLSEITAASNETVSDEPEFDTLAFARQSDSKPSLDVSRQVDNTTGLKSDRDAQMGRNQAPKQKVTPNVNLAEQLEETEDSQEDDEPREEEVFELKVGNKTYQAKGIEALKAAAQRGMASQQSATKQIEEARQVARRAQEMMREAEEARRLMKVDPAKAFRDLHGDRAEELMESILLERAKEHAELQGMTPRERELYQAQKEYKAKLAGFEKQKAEQEAQADEQLVQQQRQQIEGVFTEALTKHDLPVNNATVRVMAAIYKANIEAGVEMTAEQAATATKKQLGQISSHVIKGMSAQSFIQQYPELAQSVRQHFIKNRNTVVGDIVEAPPRTAKPAPKPRARISSDEQWKRDYEKMIKQGDRDLERLNKGRG